MAGTCPHFRILFPVFAAENPRMRDNRKASGPRQHCRAATLIARRPAGPPKTRADVQNLACPRFCYAKFLCPV